MDRPTYLTKLASIEQELPKLANTLNAMKITDTVSYGKIYEELSLDAAQRAEKITCSLRSLIFAANLMSKPMLLKKAADIQGITVTHSSGIVQVTLPGLMPKKAKYSNTAYLTDPLYTAFELYVKEHPLPHFKDCVVSFCISMMPHCLQKEYGTMTIWIPRNASGYWILLPVSYLPMTAVFFVILSIEQNLAVKTLLSLPSWKKNSSRNGFWSRKMRKITCRIFSSFPPVKIRCR